MKGAVEASNEVTSGHALASAWVGVLGLVLLGMALAMILAPAEPFIRHAATRRWRETPCVIETAEVVGVSGGGVGKQQYQARRPGCRLDVMFRYEVEGRIFRSSRLDLLNSLSLGPCEARGELAEGLRSRAARTCFVHPERPEEAILFRERPDGWWIAAVMAVIALLPGVLGTSLVRGAIRGIRRSA